MQGFVRRALIALALPLAAFAHALAARGDEPAIAAADGTLERAALIRAVLARNASAAAAGAALRAAEARAAAAGAFGEPRLRYQLAPRSLWEGPRSGHRVELSQPLAVWGKRGLARSAASAEAEATRFELAALRLELALAASQLHDDYYFAARALIANAAQRALVADLSAASLARYETGTATKQAPLAAELEAARLEHREVELLASQRIAAAQLNALLQRAPGAALPPPPRELALPEAIAAPANDTAVASEQPALRAAEARAAAREAEAKLARRERIPDVMLMAGYDGMWDMPEMRPMLGVELELPLARARRRAVIAEADALREQAERERERVRSETALAVALARERLAEAEHALRVVREQMLPAARDQAEAANAALAAGRGDFIAAIDAERARYETELAAEEALVAASRRAAELLRAQGKTGVEERP